MRQGTFAQFVQGLTAPWRGMRIILADTSLWPLALGPVLVSALLLSGAIVAAVSGSGPLVHWLWPGLAGLWFAFARGAAVLVLALGLGMAAYMGGALLAIPMNDAMSERVEGTLSDLPPALSFREALPRSIRHSIAGFLLWVLAELLVFPAQLVPGIGSLVGSVLGFGITAWFLAHQLLDGPMSRRAMRFGEKMQFLRDHLPWVLGIGSGGAIVMMVPLVNLLGLPVLIAGGAVLWVELERDRRAAIEGPV